jgi:hypothetical protein
MENGVLCTVTESGFDQIPLERRAKAFAGNEGGWAIVIGLIGDYLASPQAVLLGHERDAGE